MYTQSRGELLADYSIYWLPSCNAAAADKAEKQSTFCHHDVWKQMGTYKVRGGF